MLIDWDKDKNKVWGEDICCSPAIVILPACGRCCVLIGSGAQAGGGGGDGVGWGPLTATKNLEHQA